VINRLNIIENYDVKNCIGFWVYKLSEILNELKDIRKYISKIIKLPIRCWVFLFGVLCFFQPRLVRLINIKNWFPNNLYQIIDFLFRLIFDNDILIAIILILPILLIELTFKFSPLTIKEKFFTKERIVGGESIEVFSLFSAKAKLENLFIEIFTTFWSLYFLFLTLVEKSQLLKLLNTDNSHRLHSYFVFFCLFLNIIYLFIEIKDSLFVTTLPRLSNYVVRKDWKFYQEITFFEYMGYPKYTKEKIRILLLKAKYVKPNMYYVAELQLTNQNLKEKYSSSEILPMNLEYKLINSSENFEEIKFHYESLKLEKSELIVDSNEEVDSPEFRRNN